MEAEEHSLHVEVPRPPHPLAPPEIHQRYEAEMQRITSAIMWVYAAMHAVMADRERRAGGRP